jgi:DNA polymerase-3 subunit beta
MSSMTVLTTPLRDVVTIGADFVGKKREGAGAMLRLIAHGNVLAVSAIGSETQMLTQEIECECLRDFEVLIPPRRFVQILQSIKDERITITILSGSVRIKGLSCQFTLATENPQAFPHIDEIVPDFTDVEAPVGALLSSLQHTLPFCDDTSTRYALGGVLFDVTSTGTHIVATDARRMLVSRREHIRAAGDSVKFVLPSAIGRSVVTLLRRQRQDGTVKLQMNLRRMLIVGDQFRVVTPSVEGRFPNWRDLMVAQNGPLVIATPVAALRRSCRLANVMTSEEHRGVRFEFGTEKTGLFSQSETGESSVDLLGEAREAITTEMAANYVLDALMGFEDHEIVEWRQESGDAAMYLHLPDDMICCTMPLVQDR